MSDLPQFPPYQTELTRAYCEVLRQKKLARIEGQRLGHNCGNCALWGISRPPNRYGEEWRVCEPEKPRQTHMTGWCNKWSGDKGR